MCCAWSLHYQPRVVPGPVWMVTSRSASHGLQVATNPKRYKHTNSGIFEDEAPQDIAVGILTHCENFLSDFSHALLWFSFWEDSVDIRTVRPGYGLDKTITNRRGSCCRIV